MESSKLGTNGTIQPGQAPQESATPDSPSAAVEASTAPTTGFKSSEPTLKGLQSGRKWAVVDRLDRRISRLEERKRTLDKAPDDKRTTRKAARYNRKIHTLYNQKYDRIDQRIDRLESRMDRTMHRRVHRDVEPINNRVLKDAHTVASLYRERDNVHHDPQAIINRVRFKTDAPSSPSLDQSAVYQIMEYNAQRTASMPHQAQVSSPIYESPMCTNATPVSLRDRRVARLHARAFRVAFRRARWGLKPINRRVRRIILKATRLELQQASFKLAR